MSRPARNQRRVVPTRPAPDGLQYAFQGPSGARTLRAVLPVVRDVKIDHGVSIYDLRETSCRWPLWADNERPETPMFCGETIDPTETYCDCHKKIAFVPGVRRAPMSEEQRLQRRIAQLKRWTKAGVRP